MTIIVHENEAKHYICPLMNGKPCQGRSCMLWRQNYIIDYESVRTNQIRPPSLKIDDGKGYCGAGK